MPDKRTHRGPHPEDAALFSQDTLPVLRGAVRDASWLLSHGYAQTSTIKIVGDRYNLTVRQRLAVMRACCSDEQRQLRVQKEAAVEQAKNSSIIIDGYNLLITIESAFAGGVLLYCRDGCIRDLASLHGTYRKVEETIRALETVAKSCRELSVLEVTWLIDRPVSNSGKLKTFILEFAKLQNLNWDVQLVFSPDKVLAASETLIATSDSAVLDKCRCWINLAGYLVQEIKPAFVIDLDV